MSDTSAGDRDQRPDDDINPPLPDGGPTDGVHGTDDDEGADRDGIELEGENG